MAGNLVPLPTPRLGYHDLIPAAQFWPITPTLMNDALGAVHEIVRDGKADPKTTVNALKALVELSKVNVETARLFLEIDSRLGPKAEEETKARALDRDLRALGWREHDGDDHQ